MTDLDIPVSAAVRGGTKPAVTWMDFWLVILMIIWGSNIAIIKGTLGSIPPFVLNGIRFSAATVVLFIIFRAQGAQLTLPRREWLPIIGLAFLGQVVYQFIWLTALHMTTVANNSVILTLVPVWVVLFNALRLQERLSRRGWLGIFLALIGVVVVISSRGNLEIGVQTLPGDLLTLGASFVWAASLILSREPLQRNPSAPVSLWLVAWAAIFQLLLGLPDLLRPDASVWQYPHLLLILLVSGALSLGIGNMIWNLAIKRLGTGRPAIYTYLEPVIAALAAIILLHEALTSWLIIGALCVLLGVIMVTRS